MIPLALLLLLVGLVLSFASGSIFATGWVALHTSGSIDLFGLKELKEFFLAFVLVVAAGLVATALVIGAAYMRGVDLGRMVMVG